MVLVELSLHSMPLHVRNGQHLDRKTAWDAYHTQFELLAQLNRWSTTEKAAMLAISLRGAAVTVLTNLPAEKRDSYQDLSALDTHFRVAD